MEFSPKIAYRFKKDFKLPFPIESRKEFFDYYIKLFDDRFSCKIEWDCVNYLISKYGSPEAFLEKYNAIKDAAISKIKNSDKYEEFCNGTVPQLIESFPSTDIYKETNANKNFLSIDLKNANFQVLKKLGIVTNSSYKDFIWGLQDDAGMTGELEMMSYISRSKYTRQVIFGNCNPKRTIAWEKYYINNEIRKLVDTLEQISSSTKLVSMNSDELIYEILPDADFCTLEFTQFIRSCVKAETDLDVNVEKFSFIPVKLISEDRNKTLCTGFLKQDAWGSSKFKCVPETYAPMFHEWLANYENTGEKEFNNFSMYSQFILHDDILCKINENLKIITI